LIDPIDLWHKEVDWKYDRVTAATYCKVSHADGPTRKHPTDCAFAANRFVNQKRATHLALSFLSCLDAAVWCAVTTVFA